MERKNNGLMVLVIILSLLVVGLGGYVIYDKFINVGENNDKVVDNNEENFINIEDATLVYEFDRAVNALENMGGIIFKNDKLLFDDMSDLDKLKFVMTLNYQNIKSYSTTNISDEYKVLNYTSFISKENLKNILINSGYFKDGSILDNVNLIDGCPSYNYVSKVDGYFLGSGCGRGQTEEITYNYKFEKNIEKNESYLYRVITKDETIDKNNLNNYDRYKFTFKDGKFYSMEKIK